jgi:hypothetical protein
MGDGLIFLKTPAPLSLIKTFRMNLISAGSISLDSTFKISFNYFREYKDRLAASAGEGEEDEGEGDEGQVEGDEEDAEGIGFKRKFSFSIFTNIA